MGSLVYGLHTNFEFNHLYRWIMDRYIKILWFIKILCKMIYNNWPLWPFFCISRTFSEQALNWPIYDQLLICLMMRQLLIIVLQVFKFVFHLQLHSFCGVDDREYLRYTSQYVIQTFSHFFKLSYKRPRLWLLVVDSYDQHTVFSLWIVLINKLLIIIFAINKFLRQLVVFAHSLHKSLSFNKNTYTSELRKSLETFLLNLFIKCLELVLRWF